MRRTLLAMAVLAAGTAAAEDRALLVGIDDYSALDGAPALTGAEADVDRMATVLTGTMGFQDHQITRLVNADATADAIVSALIDRLVGDTTAGDRVFLYFAGLGTTLLTGTPALLAHDGDSVLGEIPLTTIADVLAFIADREVHVMIDAGFDGGVPGARGLAGRAMETPLAFDGATGVWMAAGPGQFAWETAGAGVFTAAWTDGLTGGTADADDDGTLTARELSDHVTARLSEWCDGAGQCLATGRGLAPRFAGAADAVVFELPPPRPEAEAAPGPILPDDDAPSSFRETLGFVTDLFAPSNDAGLTLSISGGERLAVGDFVTFTVASERPGALVLLDVDPTGALAQVYPSRLSAKGATRLSPGRPLSIPSVLGVNGKPLRIRVTEPAGQGVLLGLFIEGDLPELVALLPAGLDGGAVSNAGQSLFEISQRLLALEADPESDIAWSATYLPYRIEP